MGWIFQGNPNRFDIDDYLSRYPELIYWHTPRYTHDILIGERAFIWRSGPDAGAIAIGTVVEVPIQASHVEHPEALGDDLWLKEKPDPNDQETGIRLDELRLTVTQNLVSRGTVKTDPVLASMNLIRMPNGTVFKLSEEETRAMERLWGVAAVCADTSSIQEGERRLRAHYVRERSPRLRADKFKVFRKTHGRLHCELCGEEESIRYPSTVGERLFEVHHRIPLGVAATPVRTTLNDLAVLCANCHRAVHATGDVDENFKLLMKHFSYADNSVALRK